MIMLEELLCRTFLSNQSIKQASKQTNKQKPTSCIQTHPTSRKNIASRVLKCMEGSCPCTRLFANQLTGFLFCLLLLQQIQAYVTRRQHKPRNSFINNRKKCLQPEGDKSILCCSALKKALKRNKSRNNILSKVNE